MNKLKIVIVLSIVVSCVGALVMLGWVLDIQILKSIHPLWVTMKFSTAFSFFISGIVVYFVQYSIKGDSSISNVALPISIVIILLFMTTLLVSSYLGIRTGVEDLFVKEVAGAVKTTVPGRPSIGTMINFILVAIAGIFAMLKSENLKSKLLRIGCCINVVGGMAIIGYIIDVPLLYYTLEDASTAMALHTAILFVMLGVALILLEPQQN